MPLGVTVWPHSLPYPTNFRSVLSPLFSAAFVDVIGTTTGHLLSASLIQGGSFDLVLQSLHEGDTTAFLGLPSDAEGLAVNC